MQNDRVVLEVGGRRFEDFLSYSLTSDLFEAADPFTLELAGPAPDVHKHQPCKLWVNGELELNGIIDRVSRVTDKGGARTTVEGRDLMALAVDSYCTEFVTLEETTLKELALKLLAPLPYINRTDIVFGKGSKSKIEVSRSDEELEYPQVQPGQTVFEVLREFATARGLLFFAMPDGRFVFDRPAVSGRAVFNVLRRLDGAGNNAVSASLTEDGSAEYSEVHVIAQSQGGEEREAADNSAEATVKNPDVPYFKPYVAVLDSDVKKPSEHARLLVEAQRFRAFQLEYAVPGHSQNGRNWQTNMVCHVEDEGFGLKGDYLVYARTFRRSKSEGTATTLRLSRLGVLPS